MYFETTEEMVKDIAARFKKIRKAKRVTQVNLSKQSNVSYGTIKRFETSGEISLHNLIKLCVALDIVDEVRNLFNNISFKNIDEVIRYERYN